MKNTTQWTEISIEVFVEDYTSTIFKYSFINKIKIIKSNEKFLGEFFKDDICKLKVKENIR